MLITCLELQRSMEDMILLFYYRRFESLQSTQCSHVLYTLALWTTCTFLSTPSISVPKLPSSDDHSSLARTLLPCGLNLPTSLSKTRSTSVEVSKSAKYSLRYQHLKFAIARGVGGDSIGAAREGICCKNAWWRMCSDLLPK